MPPFTLTERGGESVTADGLRGKVWIANFVFTRCPDVCPVLTQRMGALQQPLAAAATPIVLLSISVDPTHDTADVLRAYAAQHGAGPGWLFATGSRDAIQSLLRDGFHVAYGDDGPPSGPLTHSDRFVLVDGALRIRGYYHGQDPQELDRLVDDAIALAKSPTA